MDNIQSKITPERLQELTRILQKYKTGKAHLERRVVSAENWWKLRNSSEEMKTTSLDDGGFRSRSGWLHNVIVSKHADAMEAYPEPNILPREPGDREEARMLSSIVPVVMEQNLFEDTYCDAMWQKLKTGTGVYKVTWDADKLGGLGDISIERVDLLNLFWEPGVRDIQDSRYFYHTALHDNDILEQRYPQLEGKLKGSPFTATKFLYDDAVDTSGKTTVIDCYYKLWQDGRTVLHYVKYVGDTVLYATEDEGKPLYDHGLYPFVFDSLFPVEGSPCGYGFVDLCSNAQTAIDLMDTAFVKNTMVGAMPRYFRRNEGGVHEDEFLDLSTPLVTVDGSLGDDALKIIDYRPLSGNYMEFQAGKVNELRETSGKLKKALTGGSSDAISSAIDGAVELNGYKLVVAELHRHGPAQAQLGGSPRDGGRLRGAAAAEEGHLLEAEPHRAQLDDLPVGQRAHSASPASFSMTSATPISPPPSRTERHASSKVIPAADGVFLKSINSLQVRNPLPSFLQAESTRFITRTTLGPSSLASARNLSSILFANQRCPGGLCAGSVTVHRPRISVMRSCRATSSPLRYERTSPSVQLTRTSSFE